MGRGWCRGKGWDAQEGSQTSGEESGSLLLRFLFVVDGDQEKLACGDRDFEEGDAGFAQGAFEGEAHFDVIEFGLEVHDHAEEVAVSRLNSATPGIFLRLTEMVSARSGAELRFPATIT